MLPFSIAARELVRRLLGPVARRVAGGTGRRALIGGGVGTLGAGLLPFGGDDDAGAVGLRRRRRKRALTQSDKNDIAFIAATLGETTGRKFALLIAARN